MFKGKKAVNVLHVWVELFAFTLLVIGFFVSIAIKSAFLSYAVVFLFGLMSGRFIYMRKNYAFAYFIIAGLLVGYLLGNRYGDWRITFLLFVVGMAAMYIFEGQRWLKEIGA